MLAEHAPRVPTSSGGYFNVVNHANSETAYAILDGKWAEVSHRSLARFILGDVGYTGEPIRLIACDAGASATGRAQNLANKMGVEVLAPTSTAFVDANGAFWTDGVWVRFYPGGGP